MNRSHFASKIALGLLMLAFQAKAVWLNAGILDLTSEDPSDDETFVVRNFLRIQKAADGRGDEYTIDFGESGTLAAKNIKFVGVLNHSITLTSGVKKQIADTIASLSDVCTLDDLGIKIYLAPIPDLSSKEVNNGGDARRISDLAIVNCAEPMPEECSYFSSDYNDTGIVLNGLLNKIKECHNQLQALKVDNPAAFKISPKSRAAAMR